MVLMKKMNLYHLLCGAVFDGDFFDYLRENQLLTTSRLHTSGVDYIITVYEKCPELSVFQTISYALTIVFVTVHGHCNLLGMQTAAGWISTVSTVKKQLGVAVPAPKEINQIWNKASCNHNFKSYVLNELRVYDETGFCDRDCMQLLNTLDTYPAINIRFLFFARMPNPLFNDYLILSLIVLALI